ncbi:putative chaperone protein HSP31 [Amylocarpus encephaloides]|uniref:D-lactate dehydratase n=1 Tax=Amylocarpus encephaloides TaxID=45428 RepID=A0A9P8C561_9HELO|nr:putative chaperone protein HSP31 [Amylocarpus encephaloides]
MAPKVLFVLSSHDKMGNLDKPTGWYLPEFAHPYEALSGTVDITIASPKGGAAPLDPSSIEASKDDVVSQKFLKEKEILWKNTEKLSSFLGKAKDYEALFFVGGHGPMFDLATDETSHKLINEFYSHGKIISAVCHGPAALTHVKIPGGGYLLDGQAVTGFSNSEEIAVGLMDAMPFSLEDKLNEATGGRYVKADDWAAKVVVARDGQLITGQNPASAGPLGIAIKDAIFGELTTKDEV